jgi:hypothetical protein
MKARGRVRSGGGRRPPAAPRRRPRVAAGRFARTTARSSSWRPSESFPRRSTAGSSGQCRIRGCSGYGRRATCRLNIPRTSTSTGPTRIVGRTGSPGIVESRRSSRRRTDAAVRLVRRQGGSRREGLPLGFEDSSGLTDRKLAEKRWGAAGSGSGSRREQPRVTGLVDAGPVDLRQLLGAAATGLEARRSLAMGRFGERSSGDLRSCGAVQALVEGRRDRLDRVRGQHKDGSWRCFEVVGANRLNDPNVGAVVLNYRTSPTASVRTRPSGTAEFRALVRTATKSSRSSTARAGGSTSARPCSALGIHPEEMLATGPSERGSTHDVAGSGSSGTRHARAVIRMEFRGLHKDGTWRDVEAVASTG